MKKAQSAFAVFCMLAVPLHAQIIEEDEVYSTASTGDFFGRLSGSASSGGSVTNSYGALAVGYDTSFAEERGRFYFNALGSTSSLEVVTQLTDEARKRADRNMEDLNDLLTINISEDTARVDDLFVQYDLASNLEVTLGRRRVNWGQFTLLSPVSLMLPLSISNVEAVSDKVSTLFAQDQLAFSWYPTERLELSAYHFFATNLDPLFKSVLESQGENDRFDADGNSFEVPRQQVDLTDNTQSWAARAVYYANWGNIGFTYYEGYDTLGQDNRNAMLQCGGHPDVGFVGDPGQEDCPLVDGEQRFYQQQTDLKLYPGTKYGFELAIPRGDWVWKFELLHQETTADLRASTTGLFTADGSGSTAQIAGDLANHRYYQAVINKNGGRLFEPSTSTLVAFGADKDTDDWRLSLTLAGFAPDEDGELSRLQNASFGEGEVSGNLIIPVMNIAKYRGGDKNKETGFVAGFLATYFGASLYYTALHEEKFRWTIGIEAVSNLRDELAAEAETDDGRGGNRYEIENEVNFGGRLSFSYTF